jgi:aspartyl aminopeptidase
MQIIPPTANNVVLTTMSPPSVPQAASNFLSFVNASPTPFHVVQTASKLLSQAGFAKLSERDDFVAKHKAGKLIRGGKYFYTR